MTNYAFDEAAKQFCAGVDHIRRSWIVWLELNDGLGLHALASTPRATIEDIMIVICPIVYDTVQNALVLDVLFAIGRMTDPGTMQKTKEQLSADRVISDLPDSSPEKSEAHRVLLSVSSHIDELRGDRNKVLAHADLEASLGLVATKEQRVDTVVRSSMPCTRSEDRWNATTASPGTLTVPKSRATQTNSGRCFEAQFLTGLATCNRWQ